ncbi:MAG: hypothetical protein SV186_05400 [Candidatus Nanohaloarchaea archaeon]|nr:hypothetical protein [Candidatus Nanohaloarchaea archaeon]
MALFGLELGVGLSAAVAFTVLSVLWNYSTLPEIEWETITAGIMVFVATAGLAAFTGSAAFGAYAPEGAQQISEQIVPLGNMFAGLVVLWGGLLNGWRLLHDRYWE